jgi:hypothetical protein
MPSTSRARGLSAAAATGFIIAALLFGALYRIVSGTEHHAFAPGAVAPSAVHLTAGKNYMLSVPGGVKDLQARHIDVATPQCEWSVGGAASQALTVTAAGTGTKATDVVGTFVAPYTGELHIDCLGWGPMFVDDADNSAPDAAGWLLLLATISLTAGVALALAVLRSSGFGSARAAGEDDEIERLVHVVRGRSADDEVSRADGGDVLA